MPLLRIANGPNKGVVYEIEGDSLSIGREGEVDVQIFDKGASRMHAEVFQIGEMFFLRDLESRNGTFINDEKVEEELLRSGDVIRIGKTALVFEDGPVVHRDAGPVQFSSHESGELGKTIEFNLDNLVVDESKDLDEETARARRSPYLRVLYQLGKAYSTEKDVRKLMDTTISATVEALDADHGFVFSYDEAGGSLSTLAFYDTEEEMFEGIKPSVSKTIIKRVIETKRPIMTRDATVDSRFRLQDSVVTDQIRSVICVPMSTTDRMAGVIYIAKKRIDESFSSEDLELATTVAIQSGMAFEAIRATEAEKENFISIIKLLFSAIELRDPTATERSGRVATYAVAIGEVIGLSRQELYTLKVAALMHNVSYLALTESDIEEARVSTEREEQLEYIQALIAEKLFSEVKGLQNVLAGVKYHNERYDGSGYPDGLEGEEIPLHARIIGVSKTFDRLLYDGSVRNRTSLKDALIAINRLAQDGAYDQRLARALTIAHRRGTLKDIEDLRK